MSRSRAPRGVKPRYFADPATDKLLQMVITLAGELSVVRDRLDLIERLAARKNLFEENEIEALKLTEDDCAERELQRSQFVARVLRVLDQDLAEITDPDSRPFGELVDELGKCA